MAIEESVVSSIVRGVPEEFAATVPDLTYLAVSVFFGNEAAQLQLQSEADKPATGRGGGARGQRRPE
jgi:hypothetical protein